MTICLSCLLAWPAANAAGISIERASGRIKDSSYLMDARISYELSSSVIEALMHGIQLKFDVTVEVKRERNWIWDKTVKTDTLNYQLEYQPLSSNYLVTNLNSGDREQLQDLEEALSYLGTINDHPLIHSDEMEQGSVYNCFIKSELIISRLPLPLQPLAYVSPNWHLDSHWYEWTIR